MNSHSRSGGQFLFRDPQQEIVEPAFGSWFDDHELHPELPPGRPPDLAELNGDRSRLTRHSNLQADGILYRREHLRLNGAAAARKIKRRAVPWLSVHHKGHGAFHLIADVPTQGRGSSGRRAPRTIR